MKNAYVKPTKGEFKMPLMDLTKRPQRKMTLQNTDIVRMLSGKYKKNEDLKKLISGKDEDEEINLQQWKQNKVLIIKEKMKLNIQQKNSTLIDKIKEKEKLAITKVLFSSKNFLNLE
jgi:hypothetical protein